jgi:hypothetical protein
VVGVGTHMWAGGWVVGWVGGSGGGGGGGGGGVGGWGGGGGGGGGGPPPPPPRPRVVMSMHEASRCACTGVQKSIYAGGSTWQQQCVSLTA